MMNWSVVNVDKYFIMHSVLFWIADWAVVVSSHVVRSIVWAAWRLSFSSVEKNNIIKDLLGREMTETHKTSHAQRKNTTLLSLYNMHRPAVHASIKKKIVKSEKRKTYLLLNKWWAVRKRWLYTYNKSKHLDCLRVVFNLSQRPARFHRKPLYFASCRCFFSCGFGFYHFPIFTRA